MFYKPKRPPRVKQREALAAMKGHRVFALNMWMRTGKSKVILDDWGQLVCDDQVHDLLIIAPGGAYNDWEKAIADDVNFSVKVFVWVSKDRHKKSFKLMQQDLIVHRGPRILLINVEALGTVRDAREFVLKFMQWNTMVVVSESVSIKNPKALRTKFINGVIAPKATYRRIESGLITPKSPLDLYCQFEFLDRRILGKSNWYAFRNRYAIVKKVVMPGRRYPVPLILGYQHLDELNRKIAPYVFRVRLEDCYDMPPSDYSIRDVPLSKEQEKIYADLKKFATAKINAKSYVTAQLVITQMMRLHQVLCGHTIDDQGNPHEIPQHRIRTLLELLDDYEGKAIIWASYDVDIKRIANALALHFREETDYKEPAWPNKYVARFWGGNVATRLEEENNFKTNPACRFIVATPDAGKYSHTWDMADLVTYYSNTDNLDHRAQSEARAQNVGKMRPISYVDLVARGTVDEKILHAIRNKINLSAAITKENWREWVV